MAVLPDPSVLPSIRVPGLAEATRTSAYKVRRLIEAGIIPVAVRTPHAVVLSNIQVRQAMGWPLTGDLTFDKAAW